MTGKHRPPEAQHCSSGPEKKRSKLVPKSHALAVAIKPKNNSITEQQVIRPSAISPRKPLAASDVNIIGDNVQLLFTVVQLTMLPTVQVCYGCSSKFAQKYRSYPNELILKTNCRRRYRDKAGVERLSNKVTAVYCHLKMSCVQKLGGSKLENSNISNTLLNHSQDNQYLPVDNARSVLCFSTFLQN